MDGPSTDSGGATVISESVTAPAEMVTNMALPWPEPSATSGTYDLHCHCATIRLKIKLSPPLYQEGEPRQYTAIQCSCSYCTRTGYIAAYPFAGDVEFTQGLEHRGEYRTGAMKANPFWFCKLCGCVLGGDLTVVMRDVLGLGGETDMRWSVNLRMLKDFDLGKLLVHRYEASKALPPCYEESIENLYQGKDDGSSKEG